MGNVLASDLVGKFQYALDQKWGYIWGAAGLIWTEERQKAATREQTIEYGSQWIGRHVADCSGLFRWAFDQLDGYMYHGSNTMWDKYTASRGELQAGRRTDGHDLLPGTAVFTDKDGSKNHVGLYVGNGNVIEAANTRKGVISSLVSDKKWTHWAVLKGVTMNVTERMDDDGNGPAPGPGQAEDRPTLRKGDSGSYVQTMQMMLIDRGYSVGGKGADGIFGEKTLAAVKEFQRDNGLKVDGICGPKTWAAMDGCPAVPAAYTVTISGISKEQASELLRMYPEADVREERGGSGNA